MKKRFSARVKLTFDTLVEVEAESKEEALAMLKHAEWVQDNLDSAELVDWSDPRELKEEKA
jgi:hypothetical protein